jgi:membrane protease YdiL (CAAX protease family)
MTALLSPSSPLAEKAERYWVESRQPLASLIFIAPLLVIYEAGVLVLGRYAVRNGADTWLRQMLDQLGFGQYFLLPALAIFILLSWHHLTRHPWQVSSRVLYGMVGECVLLSLFLRLVLELQSLLRETVASGVRLEITGALGTLSTMTAYLGAGIYEELLFRLLLLPLLAWLLRRLTLGPTASLVGAMLLTSLLFAVAHNVGPYGETFVGFNFLFRLVAGMFFAVLFVYRGFGITVGAHAGYDILVGLARF